MPTIILETGPMIGAFISGFRFFVFKAMDKWGDLLM